MRYMMTRQKKKQKKSKKREKTRKTRKTDNEFQITEPITDFAVQFNNTNTKQASTRRSIYNTPIV
jgi:hypothetical protein